MSIIETYRKTWLPMVRGTHVRRATVSLVDHAQALRVTLIDIRHNNRYCPACGRDYDNDGCDPSCEIAKLLEGTNQ